MTITGKRAMDQTTDNNPSPRARGKTIISAVLAVLLIGVLAAAYYFYSQVEVLRRDPNKIVEQNTLTVTRKVEKLIALPEGEVPLLATVSDLAPLAGNPFFAKAKVGDQVLVYAQAGKAFLYNPEANIIVQVASLVTDK